MTALETQVIKFVEDLGTADEAAEYLGTKPSNIRIWLKTKRIPMWVADKMLNPEPEAEVEEQTEDILAAPEVQEETFDMIDNGIEANHSETTTSLDDERFLDLHTRLQAVEQQLSQINQMRSPVRSGVQGAANRVGQSYGGAPRQPATPPPGNNAYQAGVQTGMAPTREQAYWSSRGQRGAPAGPAKRMERPPGSPGTYNWNSHKPKPKRS